MKKRSLVGMFFLPIITVGIYSLYWWYVTFKEAREYTGDTSLPTPGKVIGFMFIPVFNIIWSLILVFSKVPKMVNAVETKAGQPLTSIGTFVLFALVPPLQMFYLLYTQSRLNKCV